MAEVSIGGISFKGGKMLAVILALSSTVGVLYGGFEMFKKFQDSQPQNLATIWNDLEHLENLQILVRPPRAPACLQTRCELEAGNKLEAGDARQTISRITRFSKKSTCSQIQDS